MRLSSRNVLVTGAGGFIGSHLTEKLVELGAMVRCFVRYNSRNDWGQIEKLSLNVKNKLDIFSGNLRDPESVRHALNGIDIVFHLGAIIAIPYSYTNPRETIETNVIGSLNMLCAAKEFRIEKFIHTSTSEAYGTAQYSPINEIHPLKGQSPYSASKIAADKIAESFYKSFELPVTTIRPFNTFGPRQSARAIIPTIITQALQNKVVKLGSLFPKRDFTYVKDTVNGFIKIAESDNSIGEVINIGSGKEISIGEIARKIIKIIDPEIEIVTDETRIRPKKSEVQQLISDISKAKKLLGWEPKYSLEEGLKETIDWMRKNIKDYKTDMYVI